MASASFILCVHLCEQKKLSCPLCPHNTHTAFPCMTHHTAFAASASKVYASGHKQHACVLLRWIWTLAHADQVVCSTKSWTLHVHVQSWYKHCTCANAQTFCTSNHVCGTCVRLLRLRRMLWCSNVSTYTSTELGSCLKCTSACTRLLWLRFLCGAQLSTCKEFADDFVSEYSTFKGEQGEAEAYCYFFRYASGSRLQASGIDLHAQCVKLTVAMCHYISNIAMVYSIVHSLLGETRMHGVLQW